MRIFQRDQSIWSRWWWTVDHLMLAALCVILLFGMFMVTTASPAVAERIGVESFYFVRRQVVFLMLAISIMLRISLLPVLMIRRLAALGFAVGVVALIVVLLAGTEVKGARRWLSLGALSLQPSEFVKPFFAVVTAWLLSEKSLRSDYPGYRLAIGAYGVFALLLVLQPDFGMTVTVSLVWGSQLFLAGLPWVWIALIGLTGCFGVALGYLLLPHVAQRINHFFNPEQGGDGYQVQRSLEAFINGGLTGKGPGEGRVKQVLPDSHTDFIFSVVGEELGGLVCLGVMMLFAFVVLRGFWRLRQEADLFVLYASAGLLMQFGLQAMINMGVALHLLPTKGMTLPFISYGGSSMLAMSLTLGMVLALTRRRYGQRPGLVWGRDKG